MLAGFVLNLVVGFLMQGLKSKYAGNCKNRVSNGIAHLFDIHVKSFSIMYIANAIYLLFYKKEKKSTLI